MPNMDGANPLTRRRYRYSFTAAHGYFAPFITIKGRLFIMYAQQCT